MTSSPFAFQWPWRHHRQRCVISGSTLSSCRECPGCTCVENLVVSYWGEEGWLCLHQTEFVSRFSLLEVTLVNGARWWLPGESVHIIVLSSAPKGHHIEIAWACYFFASQGTSEMLFLHCLLCPSSHPCLVIRSTSNFSFVGLKILIKTRAFWKVVLFWWDLPPKLW